MQQTKTIRVGTETCRKLLNRKADLEIKTGRPLSFDHAIGLLFDEVAGSRKIWVTTRSKDIPALGAPCIRACIDHLWGSHPLTSPTRLMADHV